MAARGKTFGRIHKLFKAMDTVNYEDILWEVLQQPLRATSDLESFETRDIVAFSPETFATLDLEIEEIRPERPASQPESSNVQLSFTETENDGITTPARGEKETIFSSSVTPRRVIYRASKQRVCHECGRKFKWPHRLQIHLRKHTNEKPLQCKYDGCTYRAKWVSTLSNHHKGHRRRLQGEAGQL